MRAILISTIQAVSWIVVLVVIIDVLLSYFLSPYHPLRINLDKIVNPMLAPIRRIVPSSFGLDFSPIILILLVQVVEYLLISLAMAARF